MLAYQIRGFAFDDELLLLEVLQDRYMCQLVSAKQKGMWLGGRCEHAVEIGTCRFTKVELCPPAWASDAP